MKLSLPILLLALFMYSCKKDDKNDPQPVPQQNTSFKMSCTLDGAVWNTDSFLCIMTIDTGAMLRTASFTCFQNQRSVSFAFTDGIMHQAFPADTLVQPECLVVHQDVVNGVLYDSYISVSSRVYFSSVDTVQKTVSGTFEAVVVEASINDTVVIGNGVFNGLQYSVYYTN